MRVRVKVDVQGLNFEIGLQLQARSLKPEAQSLKL